MSRALGAGAYVQSLGTGVRPCFRSTSRKGAVVGIMVSARALFPQLHQDVVQQRRGAVAIEVRREPVGTEGLVELDEVLDGLLRLTDATGGLHSDLAARLLVDVPDRLEHAE